MHTPKRMVQESQKFFGCVPNHKWVYVTYIRIVSLAWGAPVWAKRLINQKRLLLVMVGINIILSSGNEYVKLSWEFTGRQWRENRDFLHLKKFEMTKKTRKSCTY